MKPMVMTQKVLLPGRPDPCEQWENDQYVAHVYRDQGEHPMVHISLKRHDKEPITDWRDKQAMKNQLAGEEWEAVELYPAESRLVDSANQFHLWCFPFRFPFGFSQRLVRGTPDIPNTKQRPFDGVVEETPKEVVDAMMVDMGWKAPQPVIQMQRLPDKHPALQPAGGSRRRKKGRR